MSAVKKILIDSTAFDALPQLSRELVNGENDGAKLAGWYDALIEKASEISAFSRAMDEAGIDNEAGAGKIAFCRIAARWIEHRLMAIGHPVPYPPQDPRTRELHRNQTRIAALRAQNRSLGGDPDESRATASLTQGDGHGG